MSRNVEDNFFGGFEELDRILKELAGKAETSKVEEAMEKGAQMLVNDVRSLPKPRSEIAKSGYTHLLDTVLQKKYQNEIEVGWGKYYGPMVDNGTVKMRAQSHLRSTFNKNKNKYYETMIRAIWR